MNQEPWHLVVASEQAGTRLDRFVAEAAAHLSRSYVKHLIESDHILLNGQAAKPGVSLRAGDVVQVVIPEPRTPDLVPEPIPLTVVFEDDDVVVIDKPAGMVVHPAPGHSQGTLVHALLARYPNLCIGGDVRPGIVHRLDQHTSGLLVVARNDQAMRWLTEQQKARQMHKVYLAVVEGRVKDEQGVIDAPIGRHPTDRTRQAVVANGRDARTHYRVLEALGDYTLLEVTLETGRTHQIRVHWAYQHRPVLGDPTYGPRKPRARFGLQRQFLHAHKLGFVHPVSKQWVLCTSPLPDDLAQALETIRARAASRG